jgi:hypothetical protein
MVRTEHEYYAMAVEAIAELYDEHEDTVMMYYRDEIDSYMKFYRMLDEKEA